ncbi:MAG: CCA tRNA nucleotidyltransferase [Bythopirellula sp.]
MADPTSQREFALKVVRQLRDAGHEALWAGGCVRDELLGKLPEDYDVATRARPEQVREIFGKRRTLAIGASFGVIAVLGGKQLEPIEVATFRSDGAYLDGRHPTEVRFTTAAEDAQRRDFTMNGLFYDPIEKQVIDYVGGEQDLHQGMIRAIGDPDARFGEDKLRMLRAVRFATTFGFDIDGPTLAAIRSMADDVKIVSAERIGMELRRVLVHAQRDRGVLLLHESGLLRPLLPGVADLAEQDVTAWQELLACLQRMEDASLSVAFAALMRHADDLSCVRAQGREFRFTNKEIERTTWLLEKLETVERATTLPWPQLQRVLVQEGAADLLSLASAIWGAAHEGVKTCQQRISLPNEQFNPEPLVTGDDLVAHGLQPGKYFGELLDFVRDAQLENQVADQQQALRLVEHWLQQHPQK